MFIYFGCMSYKPNNKNNEIIYKKSILSEKNALKIGFWNVDYFIMEVYLFGYFE